MDPKEKCFFKVCYELTETRHMTVREVIDIFDGVISREQIESYLRDWHKSGFYDYGTSLDLGRFLKYKIPVKFL